ncbi:MAG TPA: hypothetical protein VGK87_15040 [Anaerolineae bacterium]|jgi:hypothetical protein
MNLLTIVVVLFVMAIALVAVILILSLTRMQERKLVKNFTIDLTNKGNARTRYELWADDTYHDFRFEFTLNGARLGSPASSGGVPAGQNLLQSTPARPPVHAGASFKDSAVNAGEKVSGFSQAVGGVFDTLGHLLPGGAGSAFLSMSERMRAGQASVDRTKRVSAQAQAMVSGRQGNSLMGGFDDHTNDSPNGTNPMMATDAPSNVATSSMRPQTTYIEPGKQVQIKMAMRPVARLKTERAPFKVYSKSLETADAEPLGQDGVALFKGMTGLMFYLPQIVVGVVALVLIVILLAFTRAIV